MLKPKVAIFTSSEGHLSIAQSIEQILGDNYRIVTYYKRDSLMSMYVFMYQFFPFSYQIPFMLTKQKGIGLAFIDFVKKRYDREVRRFLKKHQPDIVISTFFIYNHSLATECADLKIPWLNVVTDPRTIHPLLLSKDAVTNFVFDQQSVQDCLKMCADGSFTPIGWYLRPEFTPVPDRDVVRRQLGLQEGVFTMLLTTGSEGTNVITTILPTLLSTPKPLQLVLACGNNKGLLRSMRTTSKVARRLNPNVSMKVLGFTHEMHSYMQAADLIVGKGGPNSLFEAAATHTPFVCLTHIAGQEDGNLDIIKQYRLGYVEENPFRAAKLLKKIIARPSDLQKFRLPIEAFAAHIRRAPEVLENTVAATLKYRLGK